jgi:hypothetical protein
MRSTFWGVVTGLLLFFPGTVLVQWLTTKLGLYQTVSLTDSCLVLIMVLLTVAIFQQRSLLRSRGHEQEHERTSARRAAGTRSGAYGEADSRPRSRRRNDPF